MTRFGLYGKITAHPGEGDALAECLLEAAELLRDVTDCELYVVSRSPNEADTVWVTEVWSSQAAHAASLASESVEALIRRALPLIAGAPERIETVPVGGKGLSASG